MEKSEQSARDALQKAFAALSDALSPESHDLIDDAIFRAIEAIGMEKASDDLDPRQKLWILASAIYAKQIFLDDVSEVHPYSTQGLILAEVISTFIDNAIFDIQDRDDSEITVPTWAHGPLHFMNS